MPDTTFDPHCRLCPRLSEFLDVVQHEHPNYHCAPVGPFGDTNPRLLIVGLAPGMHGANRTGRPFTGDYAGILLYQTLFDLGLSNMPTSESADDDLILKGVRISNAVKCLPPQNKPEPAEIRTCNRYLAHELHALPKHCQLLALGTVAHRAVLLAYNLRPNNYPFAHGGIHALPDGRRLTDSYHCSRYNTQTRRLTAAMFRQAVELALAEQPD